MTLYTIKDSPATPCDFCGGLQEGQCADSRATFDCGMFQVANDYKPAIHFVGFTDDRYWNAVKVFGLPDIVHRLWDYRAKAEIVPGDIVIFAKYDPSDQPTDFSWNDSERF